MAWIRVVWGVQLQEEYVKIQNFLNILRRATTGFNYNLHSQIIPNLLPFYVSKELAQVFFLDTVDIYLCTNCDIFIFNRL